MSTSRGDVILVRFPSTDLQSYKLRPALIVHANDLDTGYDDRIVAMITSRLDRAGPSAVTVKRDSTLGTSMGLLTDSVVVLHRLTTVHASAFDRTIGNCTSMDPIDRALQVALGLNT